MLLSFFLIFFSSVLDSRGNLLLGCPRLATKIRHWYQVLPYLEGCPVLDLIHLLRLAVEDNRITSVPCQGMYHTLEWLRILHMPGSLIALLWWNWTSLLDSAGKPFGGLLAWYAHSFPKCFLFYTVYVSDYQFLCIVAVALVLYTLSMFVKILYLV